MGKLLIQVHEKGRWVTVARTDRMASERTALAYQAAKRNYKKVRIRQDGTTLLKWRYNRVVI